jgi:hypothetical protein
MHWIILTTTTTTMVRLLREELPEAISHDLDYSITFILYWLWMIPTVNSYVGISMILNVDNLLRAVAHRCVIQQL